MTTPEQSASSAETKADWLVFVCYRRDDGRHVARQLFERLHRRRLPMESPEAGVTNVLDVFLDVEQPAFSDYRTAFADRLASARGFIYIATASAAMRRGDDDHVRGELNEWLSKRQTAPIIIDPYGVNDDRYVPPELRARFPDANRIQFTLDDWAALQPEERVRAIEGAVDRIRQSLALQAGLSIADGVDLQKRSREELTRALAAAEKASRDAGVERDRAAAAAKEANQQRDSAERGRQDAVVARRWALGFGLTAAGLGLLAFVAAGFAGWSALDARDSEAEAREQAKRATDYFWEAKGLSDELEGTNQALSATQDECEQNLTALLDETKANAECRGALEQYYVEIRAETGKARLRSAEAEAARHEVAEKEARVKDLTTKVEDAARELTELREGLPKLEADCQTRVDAEVKEGENLRGQVATLEADLAASNRRAAALEAELSQLKSSGGSAGGSVGDPGGGGTAVASDLQPGG